MVKLLNEEQVRAWPAPLPRALTSLCSSLASAIEDELVAVFVHGSTARGQFRTDVSNVDLVVVLRRSTPEILRRIANPLQLARVEARIESMVLVEGELARVTGVFPIFYEDMRRHHVLLFGRDLWATLAISEAHLGLRIEQELREVQIRLRRLYVDNALDGTYLLGSLDRRVRQLRSPLAALLRFRVGPTARQPLDTHFDENGATVLQDAGRALDVDVKPLLVEPNAKRDGHAAAATLMHLMDAAVDEIGRLLSGSRAP